MLNLGFVTESELTPEFKSFALKFKNALTKEIQSVGATLVTFSRNHFECSGFFKFPNGQHYYFRLGDVRMWNESDMIFGRMLMRSARSEKDYTGGKNNFLELKTGMLEGWFKKFEPQHIPQASFSSAMKKVIG